MPKVQIFKHPDGSLSIRYPGYHMKNDGETEEEFIERTSSKLRLRPDMDGTEEHIIDSSELPSDRTDRESWVLKNGKIKVDPVKKAEKQAKKDEKKSVLNKLGITEEEFEKLRA